MRFIYVVTALALLVGCQRLTTLEPNQQTSNPSTETEVFDASAPVGNTRIKSMIFQSSYTDDDATGPRYEYQYSYDSQNRLVKLDYWGYGYKFKSNPSSQYANYIRRVATITYNEAGRMIQLNVRDLNEKGAEVINTTFPVLTQNGDVVVYNKTQWHPNPFVESPVLRITSTNQVTQIARPWNGRPDVQFALNNLGYDASGNVKDITFAYLDRSGQPQQSARLTNITHTQYVRNPFANDRAYQAAHFLVDGGLAPAIGTWLSYSQNMPLTHTINDFAMEENQPRFYSVGQTRATFKYTYNGDKIPITLTRTQNYWGRADNVDTVTFTY